MWRILLGIETIALIFAGGNLFLPGDWHAFWQSEAVCLAVSIFSCVLSVLLEKRAAIQEAGTSAIKLSDRAQVKLLAGGLSLVAVLLVLHLQG